MTQIEASETELDGSGGDRNTPEILEQFELIINTTSMEEAMEQQARDGSDEPDAAAEAPQDEASGELAAE